MSFCIYAVETDYMAAGSWYAGKNVTFADGKIVITGKAELVCRNVFPVDPNKKYIIKVEAARTAGTKPSLVYIAFRPLDSKGQWIPASAVTAVQGTETTLTAPVKAGDKILFVADASAWNTSYRGGIHYNAKADLSDIPNRLNLNSNPVSITKDGDQWKIELDKPVNVSLPQGLPIRQSRGGGYFHVGAKYLFGPQIFEAALCGHAAPPASGKWWHGTAKAQLQLLINWNAEAKDNTVIITGISIIEE